VALIFAVLVVLLSAELATADDAMRLAMARLRLTTDPKIPVGCTPLGSVDDNSVKRLRVKVVRLGGDTALLSFPTERLERITAIVFRCPPAAAEPSTPPAVTSEPPAAPRVPPPASAPPPPPPPGSAPAPR